MTSEESYKNLTDWLFSQIPSYQTVGRRAYKSGIETMKLFDCELGHPHESFPSIHIAGTNGKGSTSHILAAGLSSCGMKVGLYTSPHLKDFRERMRIVENGSFRMISEDEVVSFIERWKAFFESEKPSFFEITTGMAFEFFAREKVDIAVIETGLGGRLDSTNIITPLLSVITNIGLEHCEHLGFTLEEIAGEKAGIIKPGVPCVVGEFLPETRPVFEAKAEACGSALTFAKEAAPFLSAKAGDLDLAGDYQQRNIVTVSAAASILHSILHFDTEKFEQGVRSAAHITGLRGRWETLRGSVAASEDNPAGKAQIICDTGHNAHGFRWIREQIDRICCDYDNIFFVFGVVADKDIDSIIRFLPRDVNYIFTQASSQRALDAFSLANIMHDHGINGRVAKPVRVALELADSLAGEKDLIFVGGSNFVVAEII
ncbi:MAG: bifunctional folylpolyglutamate synthase/dihydrofolate synthase [Bacteroidales bacterium]|nr:bifunctional folylpolyglutamate synthase/dihydrofolate synthase [Candidatus Cacconaster merdequi]